MMTTDDQRHSWTRWRIVVYMWLDPTYKAYIIFHNKKVYNEHVNDIKQFQTANLTLYSVPDTVIPTTMLYDLYIMLSSVTVVLLLG